MHVKKHQQAYKSPLRICIRCKEERGDTWKVGDNIWPGGGVICTSCIIPAAMETNRIGQN